jgi:hypothetical protein
MVIAKQATGSSKAPSKFEKVYNAVGFSKSYNFFLCM